MATDAFAGPVDYLVFTFPSEAVLGAGLTEVLRRVDEGVIEVLDLERIRVEADGTVVAGPLDNPADFTGAFSGILDAEDVRRVADALEPGGVAIALVYEDLSLATAADAWTAAGGTELLVGGVDMIDLAESLEPESEAGAESESLGENRK
ncbi:DUF6325 family protein [Leifsonia shinshuensis]|uniref:DUF1269 domain-containing protein n=1 Tax=Leifsonia shinshuensis TaxID=150026 RepID=A0A7G6Y747_9MICO|nr:DUF6325 family protein [Leifsonia shinshuensis]QNE34312.1 hypothetical protein F1C12_03595 [Leifsonia shinshuensis]